MGKRRGGEGKGQEGKGEGRGGGNCAYIARGIDAPDSVRHLA